MDQHLYQLKGTTGNDGSYSVTLTGDAPVTIRTKGTATDQQAEILAQLVRQGLLHKRSRSAITMEHETRTDKRIPVLVFRPASRKPAPLVFFQHGFTGQKLSDAAFGIRLAEAGYLAVLPDARNHGERQPKDFDKKFQNNVFIKNFFSTVQGTARDISTLIDSFADDPQVDLDRIGMAGISMGGYTTFMVCTIDDRVKVAAPLIGSPDWLMMMDHPEFAGTLDDRNLARISKANPVAHATKIARAALLVQNGLKDQVVPVKGVNRLHKVIAPMYKSNPDRYQLIRYAGVEHEVTEEMTTRMLEWFERWL